MGKGMGGMSGGMSGGYGYDDYCGGGGGSKGMGKGMGGSMGGSMGGGYGSDYDDYSAPPLIIDDGPDSPPMMDGPPTDGDCCEYAQVCAGGPAPGGNYRKLTEVENNQVVSLTDEIRRQLSAGSDCEYVCVAQC
jgi:hypothetical protein